MRQTIILFLLLALALPACCHDIKTIHVFVALCDNQYQGIVPVPEKLGNGDDLSNNLYWGASYGVKTFLKNNAGWKLVQSTHPDSTILERCVFAASRQGTFIVADAYRGRAIRAAITAFVNAASGHRTDSCCVDIDKKKTTLPLFGNADLLVYVGHDGLMDFDLDSVPTNTDNRSRNVAVIACLSRRYFSSCLKQANANPVLLTTGLMAPEAYILESLVSSWLSHSSTVQIRNAVADAYNRYQKCGLQAAKNLFRSDVE